MKKFVALILAVCTCLSLCALFASCETKNQIPGQATNVPAVYEIECALDPIYNESLIYLTFGVDANGNTYTKKITTKLDENNNRVANVTTEQVYVKTGDGQYDVYAKPENADATAKFELKESITNSMGSSPYLTGTQGYFAMGWVNKNRADFRDGYTYTEITSAELDADASVKSLLEELGCKFYKYAKEGGDKYAILAVQPDMDIVLFYGSNYAEGTYTTDFVVSRFEKDHTKNYSDLVK